MLELAGKSQAYLNRIFYKYYGQTPTAFINSCRMTEACRLLRSTEEKILDIAYSCGMRICRISTASFGLVTARRQKNTGVRSGSLNDR